MIICNHGCRQKAYHHGYIFEAWVRPPIKGVRQTEDYYYNTEDLETHINKEGLWIREF